MIRNQRERIDVSPVANRRKTGHVTRACNTCRRKKSKCDGKQPVCKACSDSGHECTWTAEEDSRRPATKQYVESLKNTNKVQQERIQQLEALLAASGLSADAPQEAGPNSRGTSPFGGLFGSAQPPPPSSQNHSPAGSFTGDLPAEAFLSVGDDPGYDSFSDTESVAESLSNAASRLVLRDGDLAVVGPSSLQFHKKSPITRTKPLDDPNDDAPKHALLIGGDEPPRHRSHSRSASFSHNRSRSHSQARSAGHSRASSVAPQVTPPPGQGTGFGFGNLSPPTTGAPYLDSASPGSDSTGQDPHSIEQQLFGQSALSPNAVRDEDGEERYDWRQMLPQDVELTRTEHDTLLDIFFKFFSSWCYRTVPDLFLRDMRRYLESTETRIPENPQSPSEEKPVIVGPKTVHYTPMLHNAMLSIALAYSEDPLLSRRSTRAKFVEKAKSTLEMECSRPSLACVQALAYIASFYSGEGEQTLGFLYFGMSIRMSQALGLSLDCSSWVRSGHISSLDEVDRVWTFWTTYCLDKCWTFYVGRDHGIPNPLLKLSQPSLGPESPAASQSNIPPTPRTPGLALEISYPTPDDRADSITWEWKTPGDWNAAQMARRAMPNTPSYISSNFYQTCKLMVLATKVMNAIWKLPKNAGSESTAALALEVDAWLEELPDSMRITRPRTTSALPHILMINMAHQWLQIILHRPFYRLSQNKGDQAIKRCDSGAEKILQYLSAWRRLYGLRYTPITTVQIAFVAGTTCLLRAIQSVGMPEKRRTSLEGVREIVRALNEMGSTWKSAKQSAEALRVLLNEQVSASERSPGPTRHPTLELQPPSVAPSRSQTMEMAYELQTGSRIPLGGNLLEEGGLFAEPGDMANLSDGYMPYANESPGSHHSGQYFAGNEAMNYEASNPGQGHFVSGGDNSAGLSIPGQFQAGNIQGNINMNAGGFPYDYPQLGQFIGANDARLRAGESFPNHPIGLFQGGNVGVPGADGSDTWLRYGYSVPSQQGTQHHGPFWGQ